MKINFFVFLIVEVFGSLFLFLVLTRNPLRKTRKKILNDCCVSSVYKIAKIEEVDLPNDVQKEVSSLPLYKIGYKKPRVDDSIDYRNLKILIDRIEEKDLTAIERASFNVCKSTILSDIHKTAPDNRKEFSDALIIIIKLYAKYCGKDLFAV